MTSDLYPTKTRLQLLDAAARGDVYHLAHPVTGSPGRDEHDGRVVTARVKELVAAGWVELGPVVNCLGYYWLTDAGRVVLKQAEATQ